MKFLPILLFSSMAVINISAQDKDRIPDYLKWNVKSFPIDFNNDGATDMTFKLYYIEDDVAQVWVDRNSKERVLTLTKSNRFFGAVPTRNFVRINDQWVLSRDFDRKPIKSDELIKAIELLTKDLGGENNFSDAISRVTFLMYQIP